MTIIYRILSFIINVAAFILGISLLTSVGVLFSSPQTMLSAFMMIAVVLYSWFSFRFRSEVMVQQHVVAIRLRDLVRVNGIVTIIFSFISIIGITPLLLNPQPFMDVVRNMGMEIPLKTALVLFRVLLVYAVILLIHILWTFALIKKNSGFFKEPEPRN